jgi:malate dehydrogenase
VKGESLPAKINDETWYKDTYLGAVGKRGAAIIEARGLSSAASAANAAIDHVRDWVLGSNGKWVSMGLPSDGDYGVPADVMFGVPVICEGGEYHRVKGLPVDEFSKGRIEHTLKELLEEQEAVASLLA